MDCEHFVSTAIIVHSSESAHSRNGPLFLSNYLKAFLSLTVDEPFSAWHVDAHPFFKKRGG